MLPSFLCFLRMSLSAKVLPEHEETGGRAPVFQLLFLGTNAETHTETNPPPERCRGPQRQPADLKGWSYSAESHRQSFRPWDLGGKHTPGLQKMTKGAVGERRRKQRGDEQFLQAGLCGLVAPSPPPPLHISLQTPARFCCHLPQPSLFLQRL